MRVSIDRLSIKFCYFLGGILKTIGLYDFIIYVAYYLHDLRLGVNLKSDRKTNLNGTESKINFKIGRQHRL